MTVSGDAKISGNGKNSRNYSNAYIGEGGTLTIGGKLTGKIGVSKYDSKVGDVVVTGADADKDYSAIFFSDNFNFDVKHDGNNIVLIPHTHVLGEWEHNGILHWHECEVCSKVLDDAEHTWDEGVITKEPTTEHVLKKHSVRKRKQQKTSQRQQKKQRTLNNHYEIRNQIYGKT